MVEASLVVTFLLTYRVLKKYGVSGMDRPVGKSWSHLDIFIVVGHFLYILGQYFLLASGPSLILGEGILLSFVLAALLVSDIQDVIYRKQPLWLYSFVLLEYILWSVLGLVAFLSGRFGEGTLFFVACLSRVADVLHLYNLTLLQKQS
jgi:hypothetical protein